MSAKRRRWSTTSHRDCFWTVTGRRNVIPMTVIVTVSKATRHALAGLTRPQLAGSETCSALVRDRVALQVSCVFCEEDAE
jgi:hypothetical protein